MSETQDIFDLMEMETLSFTCPVCNTEVIFRLDARPDREEKQCPQCNKQIPAAGTLLCAARELYADAKRLGVPVRFRCPKKT